MGLPPYQPTSDTSREAAESMRDHAATLRACVLAYIQECGHKGATRSEVEEGTGIITQSACARINELRGGKGDLPVLVVDSGVRRTGPTGRRQAVYVAVGFVSHFDGRSMWWPAVFNPTPCFIGSAE